MSLSPAASLDLGSLRYDAHLAAVVVRLVPLPGVNSAVVTLPAGVEIEAEPGDTMTLSLDGGEGAKPVLTGKVRALRRGLLGTEAIGADGGADLAAVRPAVTYRARPAGDTIRSLAGEAGVDVGTIDLDLSLAAFVAHQGRTAAEHLAELARLGGAFAAIDGGGVLRVTPRVGAQPDLALRYGREIVEVRLTDRAAPPARRFIVGGGPAGSAEAPDALRPSPTPLPDDVPAAGADAVRRSVSVLRTPAAAVAATGAAQAAQAVETGRIWARCFLLPALRPAMVVEIQALPARLTGGPWAVERVIHRLSPEVGGVTEFEGVAAGGEGFDLLGAGLALAGSLL